MYIISNRHGNLTKWVIHVFHARDRYSREMHYFIGETNNVLHTVYGMEKGIFTDSKQEAEEVAQLYLDTLGPKGHFFFCNDHFQAHAASGNRIWIQKVYVHHEKNPYGRYRVMDY